MSLHHATLKSAVAKYAPLYAEGKTEGELIEAISADEKGFDEDAVLEILTAITAPDSDKGNGIKEPARHVVAIEFRDKADFSKVHQVGDDVSHFDEVRLAHLVKNGNVELK